MSQRAHLCQCGKNWDEGVEERDGAKVRVSERHILMLRQHITFHLPTVQWHYMIQSTSELHRTHTLSLPVYFSHTENYSKPLNVNVL